MKAQVPAHGISLEKDFGNAKVFNVECDCSSDDHAVKMWIEVQRDPEVPDVEVSFYVTTWTRAFWKAWPARLRAIWDIVVHGVHKQEHHMILNRQAALNLAHTIESVIQELEQGNKNE